MNHGRRTLKPSLQPGIEPWLVWLVRPWKTDETAVWPQFGTTTKAKRERKIMSQSNKARVEVASEEHLKRVKKWTLRQPIDQLQDKSN